MADGTINQFVGTGTTAERMAFVPDPPSPVNPPGNGYTFWDSDEQALYSWDAGLADWVLVSGAGGGITQLTGDVTAGPGSGSEAATIANGAVTLAKIANAAANSKLLGSGAAGAGTSYAELTLGTNLSMSGTTLNAAAGGSGNVTDTTAFGAEPGSPSDGDLDLYTNTPMIARYNGAAWVPWAPLFKCTLPIEANYTWDNQGSATSDDAAGPLRLSLPAHAGLAAHVFYKAAPATPYSVTMICIPMISNASPLGVGLAWRQSSDGKLSTFFIGQDALYNVDKWNTATAFNAGYTETGVLRAVLGGVNLIRITDDGANRICSVSYDGVYWFDVHSVGRTDFLTADQVGFSLISGNATTSNIAAMTVLSWVEG